MQTTLNTVSLDRLFDRTTTNISSTLADHDPFPVAEVVEIRPSRPTQTAGLSYFALAALLAPVVIVAGCFFIFLIASSFAEHSPPSRSVLPPERNLAVDSRPDPRRWAEYDRLAGPVTTPLFNENDAASYDSTFEQEYLRTMQAMESWNGFHPREPEIRDIHQAARENLAAAGLILNRIAQIDGKKPGGLELIAKTLPSLEEDPSFEDYFGTFDTWIKRADAESKKQVEQKKYRNTVARIRTGASALCEIAKRKSGVTDPDEPLIDADLDEVWGADDKFDIFRLMNTSGQSIRNCTLRVTLNPDGDQPVSHVHYVSDWPEGKLFYALYPTGDEYAPNQSTNHHITDIQIELWSDDFRQTLTYEYTRDRWHHDIAYRLEGLKFTGRYLSPTESFFGNQARGLALDFSGMPYLPPLEVHITFTGGGQSKTFYWTEEAWHPAVFSSWEYRTDKWNFQPERAYVKLKFKDSGYVHNVGGFTFN